VPIPITYRIPGDDHWIKSRVLNISESGVLFGPTTLSPRHAGRGDVFSSTRHRKLGSGKQVCAAEVVRTTAAGEAAVRFEECRFLLDG